MNLKSKLFGFAAASIFALSMTTGVMAQEGGKTDVQLELKQGACTLSIESANVDFGELTWDGYKWSSTSPQVVQTILRNGAPGQVCSIQAKSPTMGLYNESGAHIGLKVEGKMMTPTVQTVHSAQSGTPRLQVTTYDANSQDSPGTYRGEIEFSIMKGQ